jgi:hypothetical protein
LTLRHLGGVGLIDEKVCDLAVLDGEEIAKIADLLQLRQVGLDLNRNGVAVDQQRTRLGIDAAGLGKKLID